MEKGDYYYFLILFNQYSGKYQWTLGKLFLTKYQLIFNHENKAISFYIKNNENDSENEKGFFIKYWVRIVVISGVAIVSLSIGLIVGKAFLAEQKRKKKANELDDDDYEYDSKDKNEGLNDNDDKGMEINTKLGLSVN